MTMRTMFDSVTAHDIPPDVEMVAGYVTGHYAWTPADWGRFPTAAKVRICTQAQYDVGDVLDVEQGDATPAQASAWIKSRQAQGYHRPTIYCPQTLITAVQRACVGLAYDLWIAHYTGHVPSDAAFAIYGDNCVAIQYANATTSGGHYDLSAVRDPLWPHATAPAPTPSPTPAPTPVPTPTPTPGAKRMERIYSDKTGQNSAQVWDNGWRLQALADGDTSAALREAGVPLCPIGHDDFLNMLGEAEA